MERVRDHRAGVAIRFCSDTQGACSAGAPDPDAMHAIARAARLIALRKVAAHLELKKLQAKRRGSPATIDAGGDAGIHKSGELFSNGSPSKLNPSTVERTGVKFKFKFKLCLILSVDSHPHC